MTACCPQSLRHRVEILEHTVTRDAIGGQSTTWSTCATVWAAIEPMSTRERWARHDMNASADFKITIRYLAAVRSAMRIAYDGRTFEIRGVKDPTMKKRWLELACEEIHAP